MHRKIWGAGIGVLVALVFMAGAVIPLHGEAADRQTINFISAPAGTVNYLVSVAQGQMLTKKLGLRAIVQPIPGAKAIPSLLENGDGQLGVMASVPAYWAYTGTVDYTRPFKSLRVLQSGSELYFGLITRKETGIRTISDLKGKRISYAITSSGTKDLMEIGLQAYGLNPAADISLLKAEDPPTALQDMMQGRADAVSGSLGGAKMVEAATKAKLVFLPFEADKVAALFQKRMPAMFPAVTPGNLAGVEPGIPVVATPMLLLCRADLPPDLAYRLVKCLMEASGELGKINPVMAGWKPEAAVRELPIPYHPGALKYYRQKGLASIKRDGAQKSPARK